MKVEDMHDGLSMPDVRKLLASTVKDAYIGNSELLKRRIKDLQDELEEAEKGEAAIKLIDAQGWDWFDVSDDIENYHSNTYVPFVGTKEECLSVFPDAILD